LKIKAPEFFAHCYIPQHIVVNRAESESTPIITPIIILHQKTTRFRVVFVAFNAFKIVLLLFFGDRFLSSHKPF